MWSWARSPRREKDPAGKTAGPHRSDAASGTAETSDGGSGPGARGLQGGLQTGWLGRPLCGMPLGVRGPAADLGQGL